MAKEPTRCYIKDSSVFRRLMWFQNNKPNEMLMGFYSLEKATPTLVLVYPERIATEAEMSSLDFHYGDFQTVGEKVDHITCHIDGTFHIKTIDGKEVYRDEVKRQEPLSANTKTFLDFIVFTDLTEKYSDTTTTPKFPHVWIEQKTGRFYKIEGKFSGSKYPVEREMAGRALRVMNPAPTLMLTGPTLKGILWPRVITSIPSTRPKGTIVIFDFPKGDGTHLIKGFVFS
jgi:hypothetical protein